MAAPYLLPRLASYYSLSNSVDLSAMFFKKKRHTGEAIPTLKQNFLSVKSVHGPLRSHVIRTHSKDADCWEYLSILLFPSKPVYNYWPQENVSVQFSHSWFLNKTQFIFYSGKNFNRFKESNLILKDGNFPSLWSFKNITKWLQQPTLMN